MAEQHEDAEADHGEALVDEAPDDNAELALRLPGQPVGVRAGQAEASAGRRPSVCMPASASATCSRSLNDEVLASLLRHSGSSGRARRRGCRRAG